MANHAPRARHASRAPRAFGLLWYVVRRQRVGLTIALAVMSSVLIAAVGIGADTLSPFLRFCFVDLFCLASVYLLGVLANADGDMISAGSGYPRHLLTLPLSTRSLVLWPMALAAAAAGGAWLLFGCIVLGYSGGTNPLWWPAAMLVATSTCLQAAMWHPFRRAYLRGLATVLAVALPPLLAGLAWLRDLSAAALYGIYGTVTVAAVLVAYGGVSAARLGGGGERAPSRSPFVPGAVRRAGRVGQAPQPFPSAMRAQVWMEWRCNGRMLPLFVGSGCVVLAFLFTMLGMVGDIRSAPLGVGSIAVSELARVELLVLPVAVLCAGVVGCCCNRTETLRRDLTLPPLQATRPLTCAEMVSAKLRMAALSALATGAVLAAFLGLWLLQPAHEGGRNAPLGLLLLPHATPRVFASAVAAFGCVLSLIWVVQTSGLSIELSGREWLFNLYGIVLPVCGGSLVLGLVYMVLEQPQRLTSLQHAAPYLMSLAVASKALLAWVTFRAVRRRALVTGAALIRGIAVWCVAVGTVTITAAYAVPTGVVSAKWIILSVILAAPATRLLSAPLSLYWNRTR